MGFACQPNPAHALPPLTTVWVQAILWPGRLIYLAIGPENTRVVSEYFSIGTNKQPVRAACWPSPARISVHLLGYVHRIRHCKCSQAPR